MSSSIHFSQLPRDVRQSIFEFLGHATDLTKVCNSWAILTRDTLEDFCRTEASRSLVSLGKSVTTQLERGKRAQYFDFFRRMNGILAKQLDKLDPDSRREICQSFQGSLSPKRTLLLHENILSLQCIFKVWKSQIRRQAGDDCPEVSTHKEMRQALRDEGERWRFKMVTKLDLSHQTLSCIPKELLSLKLVTELNLSHNQIGDLDENFSSAFTNLKALDLTGNPLDPEKYLPLATRLVEMNHLSAIKFENAAFNIILQHAAQERTALTKLWKACAKLIPDLPDSASTAQMRAAFVSEKEREKFLEVDALDLSGQWLSVLPREIFMLPNLEVLDISCNPLIELPSEITQLKKLETLNLKQTYIPRGVYPQVCEMLRECPSLSCVVHHDLDFKFKPKRRPGLQPLSLPNQLKDSPSPPRVGPMRPQPSPKAENRPDDFPLAPRTAWQAPANPPKSSCAIL